MAQRNLAIEQNAISTYQKQTGKTPSTPQEWARVHKIAYPSDLPEELKNTSAYSFYQSLGSQQPVQPVVPTVTPPAQRPVPTSGRIPLQQLQQDVQTAKGQASELIGAANPAMQVLQDALKAKTGAAQATIGESELYKKAGLTGMPVLAQSLTQKGAELNDAKTYFQNTISKMAGTYKSMADQAKFNFDAAVDIYDTESKRLQSLAEAADAHKRQLEIIELKDRLEKEQKMLEARIKYSAEGMDVSPEGYVSPATTTSKMRTDRHNNPTAFTTDIAKQAGLVEGVDYVKGDPFTTSSGATLYTARLLGDPIETTIRVIDKIGFYAQGGKQRWSHTAIPQFTWGMMSPEQKRGVVAKMYNAEGGSGELLNWKPGGAKAGGGGELMTQLDLVLPVGTAVKTRNDFEKRLQTKIASGDIQGAEDYLDGLAKDNLKGKQYDRFNNANDMIGEINNAMKKFEDFKKTNPGIYKSAIESGKDLVNASKDPKWQTFVRDISEVQSAYRNSIFGAALTPEEKALSDAFMANFDKDAAGTIEVKLNGLRSSASRAQRRILDAERGIYEKAYEPIVGGGQQPTTTSSSDMFNFVK